MVKRVPLWMMLAALSALAPLAPLHAAQDVVLLLDNSGSMRTNDPRRLAPRAVTQFVNSQGPDTRVALIEFASRPHLLLPLTPIGPESRARVRRALTALDYRGRWTDTAAAIERALYELDTDGRSTAQRVIILMTDGFIDTGNAKRDRDKLRWITQSLVPEAQARGVRIFGIAFTDQADYELLQMLAEKTGADYFRAFHDRDLKEAFQRISTVLAEGRPLGAVAPPVVAPSPPFRTPLTHPQQTVPNGQPPWLGFGAALALLVALLGAYLLWQWRVGGRRFGAWRQPAPASGPEAVLYDIADPGDIKRYALSERTTVIGRHMGYDPDVQYVVVNDRTVGRCHAVVERRGQAFWVVDQGSVNGTYVNGERVTGDRVLKHGDIIAVHRHEFEFVIPGQFESEATLLAGHETPPQPSAEELQA